MAKEKEATTSPKPEQKTGNWFTNGISKRWTAFRSEGSLELRKNYFWTYGTIWIIKKLLVFLLGVLAGFMLTGQGLDFAHSGVIHEFPFSDKQWTTYDYIDFEYIGTSYPINRTITDQVLTVHNKWTSEVWTITKPIYDAEQDGLKIECNVQGTNQTCDLYTIDGNGGSAILELTIHTGTSKIPKYQNICFKTMEYHNEGNYYIDCIEEIDITRYR